MKHKDGMWWLNPAVFIMIALMWLWYFMTQTVSWVSLGLGGATGLMFMAWAGDTFPGPFKSGTDDSPPDA